MQHVVVVEQPVEERPRGAELGRVGRGVAQPRRSVRDASAPHLVEVLDGEEDGLQQREDLVLDAARSRSFESMRSMRNWQSSSLMPSSCGPPIQTIRSHCRRTVKIGWMAENTRSPSFWK